MSGGVRLHICQLCRGLDPTFYSHHLVTNVTDSDPTYLASPLDSFSVTNLPITHTVSMKDLFNLCTLYNSMKRKQFDIVHGHGAKGGVYARIFGKLVGAKVVYTPHGGSSHEKTYRLAGWLQTKVEKLLISYTDMFVFESNYAKIQFTNKIGSVVRPSIVNYNGINLPPSDQTTLDSQLQTPIIIGAFGRLEHAKGFDLLIKAIQILIVKNSLGVCCRIYGEGEDFPLLNNLIRKLQLQKQILLMGHSLEVSKDMANCDIIVHPSRFDSMPYVPLEAMRAGKPVVVTEVGGLPEIVTDGVNGLLARPSPESIAEQVLKLCQDHHLRQNIVSNMYPKLKQQFTSQTMLSNIDSVYRSLLNSNKPES